MRPVLYQRIDTEIQDGFLLNPIQAHILETWQNGEALFSVTKVALRTGEKRQRVKRAIDVLEKKGLIRRYTKHKQCPKWARAGIAQR